MILAALLLAQAPADDPPWNCDEPIAQQEMNYCAHQDYLAADTALNAQWKVTAAEMKQRDEDAGDLFDDGRPGYFDALLEAQRAWLAYRDAHCAIEGYEARGGSMEPMLVSFCKTHLTKLRTEDLRNLVEF